MLPSRGQEFLLSVCHSCCVCNTNQDDVNFLLAACVPLGTMPSKIKPPMFSHVVIFWADPANPTAADELLAAANKYLKPIPGALHFHVGKMVSSHRPVVDQSYQVALNLVFADKKAQDDYQAHPLHIQFVEGVFNRVCKKVVVYDFE